MRVTLTADHERRILERNAEGHFGNMFTLAREMFPDNYAEAVEAIRGFLNDYDDLDIDDDGEVYEMDADDEE